jgi:flavin-binding protein dodecin
MAHAQDDANENHWPGYVDALTTMLMVLTFVMMIMGIAVFAMSQNVSRIIVETIARAALIDPPIDGVPVPELTERILEKLRLHPPRAPVKSAEQARVEAHASQPDGNRPAAAEGQPAPAQSALLGEETRMVSAQPAHVPPAPGPVRSEVAGQALVLEFQPRATRLDEAATQGLARALDSEPRFRNAEVIEVRAAVDRTAPSVTDARRVAYYRAMLVRAQLLGAGLPAARVRIFTDEAAPAQGAGSSRDLVRVVPLAKAP